VRDETEWWAPDGRLASAKRQENVDSQAMQSLRKPPAAPDARVRSMIAPSDRFARGGVA